MDRWIDLLLRLYPPQFRARFGAAMRQAFVDRVRRSAESRGALQQAAFVGRASLDAIVNGLAERLYERRRLRRAIGDLGNPKMKGRTPAAVLHDTRLALRVMRRQPILTLLSMITIAIGIGAATAIFSLVDAALLRPLPYPRPSELVSVMETNGGVRSQVAYENLADWKRRVRTLTALTPLQAQSVNLTSVDEPDRLRGGFVTSDFFVVVATPPALGRLFTAADDREGARPVAILTHQLWQRRFGGDRGILGRSLTLNNVPVTVVGIMPDGFRFPFDDVEVWLPIALFTGGLSRDQHSLFAVGRLQPGTSISDAQAELTSIAAQIEREHPKSNAGRGIAIEPLHKWITAGIDRPLVVVLALVIVLLSIAAANVTSLQLGATLGRRAEVAVRAALGASRPRIASQFLIEHAMLALAGGGLGVLLAAAIIPVAVREAPFQLFGLDRIGLDARVLTFAFVAAIASGLASGVVPALHWSRRDSADSLRASARTTGERRLSRVRAGLVIAEVALSCVLLVAGALLLRSYSHLLAAPVGFTGANVLTLEYRIPRNKYPTPAGQAQFHEAVVRQAASIPGVQHAAAVRALPFSGNGGTAMYLVEPAASESTARPAGFNTVTDDYFATLGIPVLAGRSFDAQDRADRPLVVVVSRSLAESEWPGRSPIGQELRFVGFAGQPRVVGVVGDVRHSGLREEQARAIYAVNRQNPAIFMTLAVRTAVDPSSLHDALRRAVWQVDSDQPVWKLRTLGSLVDRSTELERFLIGVLGIFGVSALVLAVTGLSGVVAQSVQQRAREIGIRLAVGATPSAAGRLVVRSGLWMTILGLAVGLPLAAMTARFMRTLLYQVGTVDPVTYSAVTVLLVAVSISACVVPARRASKLDPARVLRE